jgi:predicted nucleic acid-binding protein
VEPVDGYLLDNNIISILARPSDPRYAGISANFQAIQPGPVFLPVIAIAEIEFGMMLSSNSNTEQKNALRDFFTQYPLHLPIDDNTVEPYARLRAQLWRDYGSRKQRGYREKDPYDLRVSGKRLGIDERDLLIASIAMQYNLVLATNDQNEGMKRIEQSARKLGAAGEPVHLRIEYWPKRIQDPPLPI